MKVVCPTITTSDPHVYREQLESIAGFSDGVHLDFADGIFAPNELLSIDQAWRHDDLITHIHIMHQKPEDVLDDIIQLEADLVILHAEADNVKECLEVLQENGTRTGVALLPESSVSDIEDLDIDGLFDHVLLFEGELGYQGGKAHLEHIPKIQKIKEKYPDVELAWDGGVNMDNIKQIADAGVSVLNVGGAIRKAEDPKSAYDKLVSLVS